MNAPAFSFFAARMTARAVSYAIARTLIAGTVQLHAWNYRVESGRVLAFDSKSRKFIPLEELWAETAGAASEVGRSGVFKRPS